MGPSEQKLVWGSTQKQTLHITVLGIDEGKREHVNKISRKR